MMSFKDQIEKDIRDTFINDHEFAEEHDINGVMLSVVIDRDTNAGRDSLYSYERPSFPVNGVYAANIILYVSKADLGYKPEEGEDIKIDGKIYFVENASEEMGMLVLTLAGNRS